MPVAILLILLVLSPRLALAHQEDSPLAALAGNDLRVTRSTWWGYGLHLVFDNIHFPYTSVGFRYDLNHDQWRGPDNGNGFRSP